MTDEALQTKYILTTVVRTFFSQTIFRGCTGHVDNVRYANSAKFASQMFGRRPLRFSVGVDLCALAPIFRLVCTKKETFICIKPTKLWGGVEKYLTNKRKNVKINHQKAIAIKNKFK